MQPEIAGWPNKPINVTPGPRPGGAARRSAQRDDGSRRAHVMHLKDVGFASLSSPYEAAPVHELAGPAAPALLRRSEAASASRRRELATSAFTRVFDALWRGKAGKTKTAPRRSAGRLFTGLLRAAAVSCEPRD
jgi:hypothetical protein